MNFFKKLIIIFIIVSSTVQMTLSEKKFKLTRPKNYQIEFPKRKKW
jgi:hypothetical protein